MLPRCVTHSILTQRPFSPHPHPAAGWTWYNWRVGWDRTDRTQKVIWSKGNFTCFQFQRCLCGPQLENSSASQEAGISGVLSFRALKHSGSQTTWSEMPPQHSWCWWKEPSWELGCRATPGSQPGALPTKDRKASQDPSAQLWSHLPGQWFYLGHFENLSNTRNAADNAPVWKNERCGCASKHRDSSR